MRRAGVRSQSLKQGRGIPRPDHQTRALPCNTEWFDSLDSGKSSKPLLPSLQACAATSRFSRQGDAQTFAALVRARHAQPPSCEVRQGRGREFPDPVIRPGPFGPAVPNVQVCSITRFSYPILGITRFSTPCTCVRGACAGYGRVPTPALYMRGKSTRGNAKRASRDVRWMRSRCGAMYAPP